jgi:probable HAF family extracellular repeat protein
MYRIIRVAAVLTLLMQFSAFAQTAKYSITDLGVLSVRQADSLASAINDTGLAALSVAVGDTNFAGQRWSQAQGAQPLLVAPGVINTVARAVNYSGDIAGWVSSGFNADKAFIWKANGEGVELPTPGVRSRGFGINDYGQVVGEYSIYGDVFNSRAFLYDPVSGVSDLGLLPGTTSCSARAINRFQEVVGYCMDSTDGMPYQAFIWSRGAGMRPVLPKYQGMSAAYGFNNVGQVVGMAKNNSTYLAFVAVVATGKTRYFELAIESPANRYSIAFSINEAGQAVGESSTRAFMDANGTSTDLNTVIPSGSGWILTSAFSINASSQIVGAGTLNGEPHGYLLTPQGTVTAQKPRGK